jgi:hypothetical protein
MRQGTSSIPSTTLDSKTISGATVLPTDPVLFISLAESYFLRAEAAARGFSNEDDGALYTQGVMEAFDRYGMDATPFVAPAGAYAYPNGTMEENVEAIIEQK